MKDILNKYYNEYTSNKITNMSFGEYVIQQEKLEEVQEDQTYLWQR